MPSRIRLARFIPAKTALQSTAVGFGAGLINGLVGIGGGILIVPGLVLVRQVPAKVAVATSLACVLMLSSLALAFHLWWSGLRLDPVGVGVLLLAGIAAAQVGTWLLGTLSTRWVLFAFAGITMFSAVQLLAIALQWLPPLLPQDPPLWGYLVLGAIGGVFSGLLGVGGGGLVVLGFSVVFHTPVLGGLPVALMVNVSNSLAGVAAQWNSGRILWREAWRLIPPAVVGVLAGTALAIWLPPNALRIVFALFFIFMSAQLIRRGLRPA
jgi:uncharacterized membrane protein YfcA